MPHVKPTPSKRLSMPVPVPSHRRLRFLLPPLEDDDAEALTGSNACCFCCCPSGCPLHLQSNRILSVNMWMR